MRKTMIAAGLAALGSSILVLSQSQGSLVMAQESNGLPARQVAFKDDRVLMPISPVMSYPPQCSEDGVISIRTLEPPDFQKRLLYAVLPSGETRILRQDLIDDVEDSTILSYEQSASGALLFLGGVRQQKLEATKRDGLEKIKATRYFLGRFDKDGSYMGSTELDNSLQIANVAVFSSGNLLFLGYNRTTETAFIAIADASGKIMRFVDEPQGKSGIGVQERHRWSGPLQMARFRDAILIVGVRTNHPLIVVHPNGELQEIPIKVDESHTLDAVVASENHLYVKVREWKSDPKLATSTEPLMFELDPSTGRMISEFVANIPLDEIACATDDSFIGFRRTDEGQLLRLIGHFQ